MAKILIRYRNNLPSTFPATEATRIRVLDVFEDTSRTPNVRWIARTDQAVGAMSNPAFPTGNALSNNDWFLHTQDGADGSNATGNNLDSGAVLPTATGMVGDHFDLTATDGDNEPGIYRLTATGPNMWTLVANAASGSGVSSWNDLTDRPFTSINTRAAQYDTASVGNGAGNSNFGGLRLDGTELEVDTDNLPIDGFGNFGGGWDQATVDARQNNSALRWVTTAGTHNGVTVTNADITKWGGLWVPDYGHSPARPFSATDNYAVGDLVVRENRDGNSGNILWRALGGVTAGDVTDASFPALTSDASNLRFQQIGATAQNTGGVTREQATAIADQEALRIVRETAIRPDSETTDVVRNTHAIAVNNDTDANLSFNIEGFNDVAASIRVLSFATQADAVAFYNFVNDDATNPNITAADWNVATNTFPPNIAQNRTFEFSFQRHSDDIAIDGVAGDIISAGIHPNASLRFLTIGRPTDSGAAYSTTNYFVTWHDAEADDLTLGNVLVAGPRTASTATFDFNSIANQLQGTNHQLELFIHTNASSPNGDINHYVNAGTSVARTAQALADAAATALGNDHFVIGRFEIERIGNAIEITTLDQRLYPITNIQLRWDNNGGDRRVLTYGSRLITFPNSVTPATIFGDNQHQHLYSEVTSDGTIYYDGIYVASQRRLGFTVDEANGFTQSTWQTGDILNITENPTITDGRITGTNTDNLAHIRTVSRLRTNVERGSSFGFGVNGERGFIITAEMEEAAATYSIGPVNDLTGVRELTGAHFWLPSVANVPGDVQGNVIFRAFVPPITGAPTSINNTFDEGDSSTEDYYIYYPLSERDMIDNDIVPAIPALERNASRDGTSISVDRLNIGRLAQMDTPANRAIITDTSRWSIRNRTIGGTVGYYLVFRAGTSGIVLNSPNLGDTNIEFHLAVHVPQFYYFVRGVNANDDRTSNTALRAGRAFFTTAREVQVNANEFGFRLPGDRVIPNREIGLLRGWINGTDAFSTNGNGLYLKTSTANFTYEQRAAIAATYTPAITQGRNNVPLSGNPDTLAYVEFGGVGNQTPYTVGPNGAGTRRLPTGDNFTVSFVGDNLMASTTDGDPNRYDGGQLATLLGIDPGYDPDGLMFTGTNTVAHIQFTAGGSTTFSGDAVYRIVGLGYRDELTGFRDNQGMLELVAVGTGQQAPVAGADLSSASVFRLRTNTPQTRQTQVLTGAGFFQFDGATNAFTPLPLSTPGIQS